MSDFASATVEGGQGNVLPVSHGDDSRFLVEFYTREVEDEKETQARGRRILKPMAYCRKRAIGDPRTVWDAPVTELDKRRWPQQWMGYERGEHDMVSGTPLDSWPLLTREARITLKNWGYKTVEQVAEVTDGAVLAMEGEIGRIIAMVREHAQKFIKDQESGESERRLAAQLEERDNKIGALEAQLANLGATIERMNAERLAAPIVQPHETAPGFQPPEPPAKKVEQQGIHDLEALPQLEPITEEPESGPATDEGSAPEGTRSPAPFSRKLGDEQIAEIRASGDTNKALAERYGVSVPTIARYRKA